MTTPEKWDVVTRKSGSDDNALGNQCGLLIFDEIHLLADESRGAGKVEFENFTMLIVLKTDGFVPSLKTSNRIGDFPTAQVGGKSTETIANCRSIGDTTKLS